MARFPLAAAMLLLAACQAAPEPVARPAPGVPVPFHFDEATALLQFHYEWPVEVAAIPALSRRLSGEMESWRSRLNAGARSELDYRNKNGFPFHGYQGSMKWTAAGQSPRLLSLAGAFEEYTGGAHGNYGTRALLWDRATASEQTFAGLFMDKASPAALMTQPWCKALDAQRAEKRQGQKLGGEFDQCPKLGEIVIVPTDADANGAFESLRLIANPYTAGPYAEGSYTVDLPVTPAIIAALKPEYRASFELQRQ
jgi:hypothetical protein